MDTLNLYPRPYDCQQIQTASSEDFMAVMYQVEVFWIVTPCSVLVG
jgi:hypothetical protein